MSENANKELFSFSPREITDRVRIEEIIDSITIQKEAKAGGPLLGFPKKRKLSVLGAKLLKKMAIKVTEFPLIRIKHECKYTEEHRAFVGQVVRLKENFKLGSFYPVENPVRKEFFDGRWTDAYLRLKENKNGEIASTCRIIDCPKCNGTGKVDCVSNVSSDVKVECPNCNGTGKEGVYICKRCEGHGWVIQSRTRREHESSTCPKCGGEKKLKQIMVADHKPPVTMSLEWMAVLENIPNLYPRRIEFSWDASLKDDLHKKLVKIQLLKKMECKGAIDPNLNDLNDLLATPDTRKRISSFCFADHSEWKIGEAKNRIRKDSYYVKLRNGDGKYDYLFGACGHELEKSSKGESRYICNEERILIFSAVGIVKIDFSLDKPNEKGSLWVNLVTREILNLEHTYYADGDTFNHLFADGGSKYQERVMNVLRVALAGEKLPPMSPKSKNTAAKKKQNGGASSKKRWLFILLGLLLGCFGAHLAYAKRWFLFLVLWGGFITGNVMMSNSTPTPNQEQAQSVEQSTPNQADEKTSDDSESTNMIGCLGLALWGLLWIGGTIFIKKDGKGNRM